MKILKTLMFNLYQIYALTVKNLQLKLRFKHSIFISFISPLITIIMPIIILEKFLSYNSQFGPWTQNNFYIYQFIAYIIFLLRRMIDEFPSELYLEKFWKTLPNILIAPFNKFNLLFGIFSAQFIIIFIPFSIIIICAFFYYPITILTLVVIISLFFLLALLFSGIGLILGVLAISIENLLSTMTFLLSLLFFISCITYPFEFFPGIIQQIINLNPLYYIFDILRLIWIENDILISITMHPFHFLIFIISSLSLPFIGIIVFNQVYKKFGIVGY